MAEEKKKEDAKAPAKAPAGDKGAGKAPAAAPAAKAGAAAPAAAPAVPGAAPEAKEKKLKPSARHGGSAKAGRRKLRKKRSQSEARRKKEFTYRGHTMEERVEMP